MEKFIAQRSAPVGYAAEYLIPSLSDVLATIALPNSVTYLLRGVNGLCRPETTHAAHEWEKLRRLLSEANSEESGRGTVRKRP